MDNKNKVFKIEVQQTRGDYKDRVEFHIQKELSAEQFNALVLAIINLVAGQKV